MASVLECVRSLTTVWCICIVMTSQMAGVEAIATLELLINNFLNPSEHLRDGSCCDLWCIGQCDNIFTFSLDQASGNANDPQSYYYWTKKTGTYQDQNDNYFNDNMNGVNNPIVWQCDSWPGTVLFKVYIEDDDTGFSSNDPLDGMVQRLTLTPGKTKATATTNTITMYGMRSSDKTSMSVTYKLYCNDKYYGPSCAVLCEAQNSPTLGHYTCDPNTGAKVCRPGWEDVSTNCLTFSDDCVNNNCQNGARCVDGQRAYTCACVTGYTGRFCETNINECLSNPCQHGGTCSDLIGGFTCACASQYVGPMCDQIACAQNDNQNLCQNGGTCYGSLSCMCRPGYVGNRCELRTCDAAPCANGGSCTNSGACICPAEFTGNQCDIRKCDLISGHCLNNGTCRNASCVCQSPYFGVNCEREGCTRDTCANNGTCMTTTDDNIGFMCMCSGSYTGDRCQTPPAPCSSGGNQQALASGNNSTNDVTIFRGDVGILLIVLIVVCILLFLILIVLIVLIIYNRRRKRIYEKSRAASTTSTATLVSTVSSSIRSRGESGSISGGAAPRLGNLYSSDYDDVFCGAAVMATPGESLEKPWKDKECGGGGKGVEKGRVNAVENDYEHLDGIEKVVNEKNDTYQSDLPEQFTCDIKDIYGNTIQMSKTMADC